MLLWPADWMESASDCWRLHWKFNIVELWKLQSATADDCRPSALATVASWSINTRTTVGVCRRAGRLSATVGDWSIKPGLYFMRAYARVYARIRAHTPTVGAAVYTSVAGCAQRIRAHTPTVADKVQTCWTFKASADQRRHSSQSRKRSKVTEGWRVVLIGTYADVYRRIRSPVYTFIHGTTCAIQWRRTGSRKRGHLRRLPAHYARMEYKPGLNQA